MDQQHWWETSKNKAHEEVFRTVNAIEADQGYRHEMNRIFLQMYSNRIVSGFYGKNYQDSEESSTLHWNIVQSAIDAVVSFQGTNIPKPWFLTEDGNYSKKRKAKSLTKFCDGVFHQNGQRRISKAVFRNAGIFGTGIQKVHPGTDRIIADSIFPDEFIVDDTEGRYMEPRQVFEYKDIAREVLLAKFPKHKAAILEAQWRRRDGQNSFIESTAVTDLSEQADPVSVIEAYHLPSEPGAKDGRRSLVINNETLHDCHWEFDRFPYEILRWSEQPIGFWGRGIAEELKPIQEELDFLLEKIQRAMTLSSPQVWVRDGSDIKIGSLNNEEWSVNTYSGERGPDFNNPPPINPAFFNQAEALWRRGFEQVGITQLSATGEKPAGLNSGEAIRTFNDTGSRRFQEINQRYEDFHMGVAELYINAAKEIDKTREGGFSVLAPGARSVQQIKFKDVDLKRDAYIMQVFPTSFLPDTPSGKLEMIKELGEISPEFQQQMVALLDFPDTERALSLSTSQIDMTDLLLEEMLEKGNYRPPESFMDLEFMAKRMGSALLRADIDGVASEKLDLVRRFITESREMVKAALPPPPAPPPPGPAGPPLPGAAPGPLPPAPGGLPPGLELPQV